MKSNSEGLIIDGIVAYIDRDNIDTDQIIPTEYLKSIKKFGFEDYLFDGWRYEDDGKLGVKKEERIINKEFKLVKFYFDVEEWELYDRLNDPNEMTNVYNDPAYSEIVKDLKVKLADLRVKYKDSEELDKQFLY